MKRTLYAMLGALAGFAVGAGLSYFRVNHAVAAPATRLTVLPELAKAPDAAPVTRPISADEVHRLETELAQVERDAKVFEREFGELNKTYRERIEQLLTPEQRRRYAPSAEAPGPTPRTRAFPAGDSNGNVLIGQPVTGASGVVGPQAPEILPRSVLASMLELTFVTWSTGNLVEELELTPEQSRQIRDLLEERRQKFLELVDRTPPPSLRLISAATRERMK
jgi:hypothetical protein